MDIRSSGRCAWIHIATSSYQEYRVLDAGVTVRDSGIESDVDIVGVGCTMVGGANRIGNTGWNFRQRENGMVTMYRVLRSLYKYEYICCVGEHVLLFETERGTSDASTSAPTIILQTTSRADALWQALVRARFIAPF